MSECKLKIGITQGDPNGIGWEVILKALSDPRMTELFTPVVYGSPAAAAYYRNTLGDTEPVAFNTVPAARDARRGKANLVVCGEAGQPEPGKASPQAGRAAVEALRTATQDLKEGTLDAIVTAPFNKENVQGDDFSYTGHTEFFGAELGGEPMMILCSDVLRVGLVTKHIPVSEISRSISREKIVHDLHTLRRSLIEDFGIVEPRIAVMALNPHAGDGGLLGHEELEIIRPAIVEAFRQGVLAFGPFAADGLFAGGGYAKYDGILAMYHDQGLAPFKTLTPDGVNFTAGLAKVRTSPDHGTAYDIAGQDKADAQSMRSAIYAAIDIVEHRRAWTEWSRNPLQRAEREKGGRDISVKELPQKKIRVGAGFVAIWVLLGGAWLCDYFFGGTEFWKLASGELTVLLGIGAGTAMIREGRRGQEAENAAGKDAGSGKQAAEETRTGETQTGNTAGKDAGSQAEETQA